MRQAHLFPMIRRRTKELLGGYVKAPQLEEGVDHYIVVPGLGVNSGVTGALLLTQRVTQ